MIPELSLLVSLNHNRDKSASMELFDLSRERVKKFYSNEEVSGGKLVIRNSPQIFYSTSH